MSHQKKAMSHQKNWGWGCLFLLVHLGSLVLIPGILSPTSEWLPMPARSPLVRVVLVFLVAGLNAVASFPGEDRRRFGGIFFFMAVFSSTVKYGDVIGLRAAWERWLVGLVLSAPFFLLFAVNTPGFFKTRLDAWRARRSRRSS